MGKEEEQTLLDGATGFQKTDTVQNSTRQKQKFAYAVLIVVVLLIVGGLTFGIVYSIQRKSPTTLILISLDGFRYDYLDRGFTPNLLQIATDGIRATYMRPIFPSKTFPNHYTLVTGLQAESHGIVSNTFYDPVFDAYFRISDPTAVGDARWWGGEPVWNTVEKQGQKAACCFWPGSEAPIQDMRPSYWLPYNGTMTNEDRVNLVLHWLALPSDERPNFITLYFSIVDDYGHHYGPEASEMSVALKAVDDAVALLMTGLADQKQLDKVNIIITADHGMTTTSETRVIILDDFIDLTKVEVVDWTPVAAIIPQAGFEDEIYANLTAGSVGNQFSVYKREEIPDRYHYRNNIRITPIIAVADLGWSITSRDYFESSPGSFNGGTHGYDNLEDNMQALFIATGPVFKKGVNVDAFYNVDVYELMCNILELTAAPNNGTSDSSIIRQALTDP